MGGQGQLRARPRRGVLRSFIDRVVPVSSPSTAEAVKLTENIFRAVNIALVNELKVIYSKMGIDIWEVIEAAKTKPFGFMPFYPGPGLGGHCIPIDPFYLTWKAREFDITHAVHRAGRSDQCGDAAICDYAARRRTRPALQQGTERSSDSQCLGIAYKKNVDDMRESPTLKLMQLLEHRRAIASTISIPTFRKFRRPAIIPNSPADARSPLIPQCLVNMMPR